MHIIKALYNIELFNFLSYIDRALSCQVEVIACITVDGDEKRLGDISKGFPVLLEILDKEGLRGKVTWFINEHDYQWTDRYPNYLKQIIDRGDEIALHSHVEPIINDYDALYDYIRSIGLEYETDDYSDYIGLYLSDLGEDETLSNFRERVKSILVEKLGKYGKELAPNVDWIERCWENR